MMHEDDDDEREEILKMLRGEVSDFAGSQLDDPNKPKGVTITIAMDGKPDMKAPDMPMDEDDGEKDQKDMDSDDHIAHILGMCGGGCSMCKGGEA